MKNQLLRSMGMAVFTLCLFTVSHTPAYAAPGELEDVPLFFVPPVQPNIFFMLDDSGSMAWSLPGSGDFVRYYWVPRDSNGSTIFGEELRNWCIASNNLAYDANNSEQYLPWSAKIPGTTNDFPKQKNITKVLLEPVVQENNSNAVTFSFIQDNQLGTIDLSYAPVIKLNEGETNASDCPTSFFDDRITLAKDLSTNEQEKFANWFTYYRSRLRTMKAAMTQVVSANNDRLGMATLHNNSLVDGEKAGQPISDMNVKENKDNLLKDIVRMRAEGATPLRTRLDWVGEYFDKPTDTPSGLSIGDVASPVLPANEGGECQKNVVVLMTDGERNGAAAGVGDQDFDITEEFIYKAHRDSTTEDESVSDTLADIAMKWYKADLNPDVVGNLNRDKDNLLTKQEGVNNKDENSEQHLLTYTVAFGLSTSLWIPPADRDQDQSWPNDLSADNFNTVQNLADLQHAAYNGRGEYLNANNPAQLLSSFEHIINKTAEGAGSSSAVSFNTSSLVSESKLYFASFDVDRDDGWTGNVRAFSINENTGEITQVDSWDAAKKLNTKTEAERIIYTWGNVSGTDNDGVLFEWSETAPKPVDNILADLKKNSDKSIEVDSVFTLSKARLDYIRGDDGTLRTRNDKPLGDIIHSATSYVGTPTSNWPDKGDFGIPTNRYSTYLSEKKDRDGVIYVGANDGLLHGFSDKNDGEEILAYLPSATASDKDGEGLHHYSEDTYLHKYYVDGSPIVTDVFIKTEDTAAKDWKTILIGGLNGGGKGYYALDVTTPSDFKDTQLAAKKTVLWEFTNSDITTDNPLGFSFSEPQVALMNNGKWAVIFGNGYNAPDVYSAELFILFIEEGVDGEWSLADEDYIRIDTKVGEATNQNGLSTPTLVDLNEDGTIDRIYAGDLQGNMWAFDVTDDSDSVKDKWKVAYGNSTTPAPLFSSATEQPITMKPLIVKPEKHWVADGDDNSPNLMVYFGTGQFISTSDTVNTDLQSFYGIWDGKSEVTPGQLVKQVLKESETVITGVKTRFLTTKTVTLPTLPNVANASSEQLGWVIDLDVEEGERVTVEAFEHLGLIYFNTLIPSQSACNAGGSSWLMAADMRTGGQPSFLAFDVDGDGDFDTDDEVKNASGEKVSAAGVEFQLGIASATSTITNDSGQSFAYTSGTDSGDDNKKDGLNIDVRKLPGGAAKGLRKSWIQLFE